MRRYEGQHSEPYRLTKTWVHGEKVDVASKLTNQTIMPRIGIINLATTAPSIIITASNVIKNS